jgi:hypothetical protein
MGIRIRPRNRGYVLALLAGLLAIPFAGYPAVVVWGASGHLA